MFTYSKPAGQSPAAAVAAAVVDVAVAAAVGGVAFVVVVAAVHDAVAAVVEGQLMIRQLNCARRSSSPA